MGDSNTRGPLGTQHEVVPLGLPAAPRCQVRSPGPEGLSAGSAVGSQVFIGGRTAVQINGTAFYVTGSPAPEMWVPAKGSTSVLFLYKRGQPTKLYRLDFDTLKQGPRAGKVGWEHNQKGVAQVLNLKVTNHQPGGRWAAVAGRSIQLFRHAGRALFVVGMAQSGMAIYHAADKTRETLSQLGGWSGAWAMARLGARGGASAGASIAAVAGQLGPQVATPEEIVTVPIGTAIGAVVGGIGGFWAGYSTTQSVYDLIFEPLECEEWVVVPESELEKLRGDTD